MSKLSAEAGLNVYTNHFLRATALDHSGFEARHIMAVSGQKSEASIRAYSRHISDQKMHDMSTALTSHMGGFAKKMETVATQRVVSVLQDIGNVPEPMNMQNNSITVDNGGKEARYIYQISNCSVNIVNK